jgi:TatD DNase family protein
MLVDSHAHLTSPRFDEDRDDVIRRALDAGVRFIVNPATDLEDSRRAVRLAERHGGVYACVGIHPHEAGAATPDALRAIEELSTHPRVVAIGEIGLDFHYMHAPRDVQEGIFRAQIDIARRRDLPIVVHTRESLAETVQIVEAVIKAPNAWRTRGAVPHSRYPAPRGVFHCFPGDAAAAWNVIRMGFHVSLPGILTFKNAGLAAEVASSVSLEHFLLETDSPYMTPVPFRGKRNEPMHIPLVAARLAELQHLSVDDVARSTTYNAFRVFGIGEMPQPGIVYRLRDSLYVNLTLRCNADCVFCDRKGEAVIKGHNLRIEREPTVEDVRRAIGDPASYAEIVFCGYGEPTIRLQELKEIASWVKSRGGKTRLNTDGHGSLINKRNIVPELAGLLDAVSISLNSPDPEQYGALMRLDSSIYFPAMLEFAREAVRFLPKVVMTIVNLPEIDATRARRLVEEEIGGIFQERPFF